MFCLCRVRLEQYIGHWGLVNVLGMTCRPEDALAGVASPEAAKQLEAVLKDAPDLQGIAFVAAPPDHPAAADGSKAGRLEQPPRDRVLMLRLDFLGHVHVERMRFPWLARADAQVVHCRNRMHFGEVCQAADDCSWTWHVASCPFLMGF